MKKLQNIFLFMILALFALSCSEDGIDSNEGDVANNTDRILNDDEYVVIEQGLTSEYKSPAKLIFKSQSEFASHYSLLRGNEFDSANAPSSNFGHSDVVVIHSGPHFHKNYEFKINSISFDSSDGTRQIRYTESNLNSAEGETLYYSYLIARISASFKEYRFLSE